MNLQTLIINATDCGDRNWCNHSIRSGYVSMFQFSYPRKVRNSGIIPFDTSIRFRSLNHQFLKNVNVELALPFQKERETVFVYSRLFMFR